MTRALAVTLLLSVQSVVLADDASDAARLNNEANRLYREGKIEEALAAYGEAAATDPDRPALRYNMGSALYRLGRFDEAGGEFSAASGGPAPQSSGSPDVTLDALYNQGSTRLQMQDYQGAVDALREVLLRAPGDDDARRNLEVALARLIQQQQQEQQQDPHQQEQDPDQQKEQQEPGSQPDQPPSDDQDSSGQPDPDPAEEQPTGEQPEPQTGSEPQEGDQEAETQPDTGTEQEIGEEEARRLLEALSQDERSELKESLDRRPRNKGKPERDW